MKIKHTNGMVDFTMRTGKDIVKSQMPISYANGIVSKGKEVVEKDNQIIVDDTYFFPAEAESKTNTGKKPKGKGEQE